MAMPGTSSGPSSGQKVTGSGPARVLLSACSGPGAQQRKQKKGTSRLQDRNQKLLAEEAHWIWTPGESINPTLFLLPSSSLFLS